MRERITRGFELDNMYAVSITRVRTIITTKPSTASCDLDTKNLMVSINGRDYTQVKKHGNTRVLA